jgi:porin
MKLPSIFWMMFLAAGCCLGQAGPGSEKHVLATQIFENSRRAKSWLDERGVLGQLTLVNDWSSSFQSGTDSVHSFNRYSLDLLVGFDAQKALGWKGSSGFLRVKHHLGEHGADYVGDAQGFSNIDSASKTYLYELWLQQTLWKNRVRFKAGKIDANSEFATVKIAADFLNSSMGYSPTILSFPTYPEPRPGITVFLQPGHYQVGAGLLRTAQQENMWIVEAGREWRLSVNELPGRSSFGTWRISGPVKCFDGDELNTTRGYYLVAEQALWKNARAEKGSEQTLSMFLQYGSANAEISPFTRHLGGGIVLESPFAVRPNDAIGFGITSVRFTDADEAGFERDHEVAAEIYYRVSLTRFLSLVPDFQFIRNPGGARSNDAFVFTPRVTLSF